MPKRSWYFAAFSKAHTHDDKGEGGGRMPGISSVAILDLRGGLIINRDFRHDARAVRYRDARR